MAAGLEPRVYRSRVVYKQAMQWDGTAASTEAICSWAASHGGSIVYMPTVDCLVIKTLEGPMRAGFRWWIIKGVANEFYGCEPGVFAQSYELAEAPDGTAGHPVQALPSLDKVN